MSPPWPTRPPTGRSGSLERFACASYCLARWALGQARGRAPAKGPGLALGGIGLRYGIVLVNLGITGRIGERTLPGAGILVHVAVFLLRYAFNTISVTCAWTGERSARDRTTMTATTID